MINKNRQREDYTLIKKFTELGGSLEEADKLARSKFYVHKN